MVAAVALVVTSVVTGTTVAAAQQVGLPSGPGEIVDIDLTAAGSGYWVTTSSGDVLTFDAPFFGGTPGLRAGELVSGLTPTPSGGGYWLFSTIGRVFAFGDAGDFGSIPDVIGDTPLNGPIIDAVATPTGQGYYLLGFDGGIFAFGDAAYHGSIPEVLPGVPLASPIVGLAPTPTTQGYWLVGSDGGVFAFGDAGFVGSVPGVLPAGATLNAPVVGMIPQSRAGYLMLASDGGIFSFGSSRFLGSLGDRTIPEPITAVAVTSSGDGYVMIGRAGRRYGFGSLQGFTLEQPLDLGNRGGGDGGGGDGPTVGASDWVYERREFRDPLMDGLVAYSLLVPRGWEVDGGIEWRFGVPPLAAPVVTVRNPDSGSTLRSYFIPSFVEGPLNGQFTPVGLARALAADQIPNGTVTRVDQISPTHTRVRVNHVFQGRELDTDFYLDLAVFGPPNTQIFDARAAYSITAPAGFLDAATPYFMAVVSSFEMSLEWYAGYQFVFEIYVQGQQANQALLDQFIQQIRRDSDELLEIQRQAWEQSSATYDRIFDDLGMWIRDETRVELTDGSRMTVPNTGIPCQVVGQPTVLIVQTQSFCPDRTTALSEVR